MRNIGTRVWLSVVATGLVGVLALSGVSGAATAGSDQGVTADSVKIGFIYSKTGAASATSGDSDVGCKARVGRENAKGGVNGRKITVEYVDDQTSPATNTTGAQDLVQNQHVFMVLNNSALAVYSYRYQIDSGVPSIGAGYDGSYYFEPENEQIIDAYGNTVPGNGITYTTSMKIAKGQGATKVASMGYGISPSSAESATSNSLYAAPAAGLKAVYTNTTIDFGSTDVSPVVLGIKNSGADSTYYAMNGNTNLAIVQGLKQNGATMKAQILPTGYGQALLDEPASQQLGSDLIFTQQWAPVEAKTKATKRFQADLKKYASYTGVPDFGIYSGYTICDLAITGLQQQGKNLDRSTYVAGLRRIGHLNPAGLGCQDIDISPEGYTKPAPQVCSWAMIVKNGKFVVLPPKGGGTQYWTGTLVEKSIGSVTTTTAEPAS